MGKVLMLFFEIDKEKRYSRYNSKAGSICRNFYESHCKSHRKILCEKGNAKWIDEKVSVKKELENYQTLFSQLNNTPSIYKRKKKKMSSKIIIQRISQKQI